MPALCIRRSLSVLCSLYLSAAHSYLPSFPTRRSSDLTRTRYEDDFRGTSSRSAICCPATSFHSSWKLVAGQQMRSEEHTSELQSLTNLVCRLLLEKKKKQHLLSVQSSTHQEAALTAAQ